MASKLLKGALLFFVTQGVFAEEKFYPIVGADGNIHLIKSPVGPASKPDTATATVELPRDEQTPLQIKDEKGSDKKADQPSEEIVAAPYDSDSYTDSDVLDQAYNRPSEKRFYIINDALGLQMNESTGEAISSAPIVETATPEEFFHAVESEKLRLTADEAMREFPGLPGCISASEAKGLASVDDGSPRLVLFNRQTYAFLDKSRVVAAFKLGGVGLRTIISNAFSMRDKAPVFVNPFLAFLDEKGCITRVVQGFHEKLYPATKKRHPMLKSTHVVHSEESYMLVLAPKETKAVPSAEGSFGHASYGQLQLLLKK